MEKKKRTGKITAYIVIAMAAVAILIMLLTIIYFSVLKPQQPSLTVNEVLLQNESSDSNNATVAQMLQGLTLEMDMALQNPNRGALYYANVGASMEYNGKEIGFAMIPGGKVGGKRRQGFVVVLAAMKPATSFMAGELGGEERRSGMVTVDTKVGISGEVAVLGSFSHHTAISSSCLVSISSAALRVVTFRCGP